MYTVVLSDGTEITDLKMNGTNFVSMRPIDEAIFEFNCSPIIIRHDGKEEVHENMKLAHVSQYGSEYWFALNDIIDTRLSDARIRADLDYVAMMSGVDLMEGM